MPIRESELLSFSEEHWRRLEKAGIVIHDLTPAEVADAISMKAHNPALSANDCFCLVSGRSKRGNILTGDALLRKAATHNNLRAHGVLWVIDQLENSGKVSITRLVQALEIWRDDHTVFLPHDDILKRIELLTAKTPRVIPPMSSQNH